MSILLLLVALLLGVASGVFTGLFPGIHINLIAVILISLTFLSGIEPIVLVMFLVAMAITHTFVDYIPSVFLGAPDEDNFLSILPGHHMLMKGEAYTAVIYTLYGSAAAIVAILLLAPIFILILNPIYAYVQGIMPYILILASGFLIYSEKNDKIKATIIFFLAGFLGIAALNLPTKQPLLPLFTGLFGISSLITSIMKKQKIPKQIVQGFKQVKIKTKTVGRSVFASLLASPLVSFLPGLGAGQAAVIGSEVTGDLDQREFLILLGAINTMVMGLSFITLYSVGKIRTGTAAAINHLMKLDKLSDLSIIIVTIVIAGAAAFFITIWLAQFFAKHIHKIDYKSLAITIIVILVLLTSVFSGPYGLFILAAASAVGFTCIQFGIRRTHLMGALLLPVILLYLF